MKNNFKYYNPNPNQKYHKDGTPMRWTGTDCTIRSICAATGMTWKEAFKFLFDIGMEISMTYDDIKVLQIAYEKLNFKRFSFPKNQTKPTVKEFTRQHQSGIFILSIAGHVTCIKNGIIHDTWDCSDYKVRSYYSK